MMSSANESNVQPSQCLRQAPVSKTGMLIRKPIAEVFEAFVNPAITSNFWFTHGSDRLQVGKPIRWDWEMYGQSIQVNVKELHPNKRILMAWTTPKGTTVIEWEFISRAPNETFVGVTHKGFEGDGDECVAQALESTEGFSLVLAGAKAFLEQNIRLNLIADRYPDHVKMPS